MTTNKKYVVALCKVCKMKLDVGYSSQSIWLTLTILGTFLFLQASKSILIECVIYIGNVSGKYTAIYT